jgi:F-type H+-transporting ATPase subunit epsilon
MKLSLYSLDRKISESIDVTSVTFPGPLGESQVLSGHTALVSQIQIGEVRYLEKSKKRVRSLFVSHGFIRIEDDHITICGYTLEHPKEINVDRALKAQKQAEEKLRETFSDISDFRKYELKLQRALIRQQVAKQ